MAILVAKFYNFTKKIIGDRGIISTSNNKSDGGLEGKRGRDIFSTPG